MSFPFIAFLRVVVSVLEDIRPPEAQRMENDLWSAQPAAVALCFHRGQLVTVHYPEVADCPDRDHEI